MEKKAYFIGIKGVGMTALALAMQDAGWSVSGSDTKESFITDDVLNKRGIRCELLGSVIPSDTDLIIHSAAYEPQETNIRTLSLAEAVAEFVKDRKVIAVAGVGGKTTTTAMLAALFYAAGRKVGYYVGTGSIAGLDAPGTNGSDPYFVVEADEYAVSKSDRRAKFELLEPDIVITTNIVHDHPDIYENEDATIHTFEKLLHKIKPGGVWIYNAKDRLSKELHNQIGTTIRTIAYSNESVLSNELKLSVFGDQNKIDAVAAVLGASEAGIPPNVAKEAIGAYKGAGRRQEFHGEVKDRLLYDDYGHHPGEIEVTVRAFKENFKDRRLILVFESHTYTRTERLLGDFAKAISTADISFIMPIFESAREKGQPHSVTPELFAQEVCKYKEGCRAITWENAADVVSKESKEGDVILTMGAGFVYKLHDDIRKILEKI